MANGVERLHDSRHAKANRQVTGRGGGFYRANGWPLTRLRNEFLRYLVEECPELFTEYGALVPLVLEASDVYQRYNPGRSLTWRSLRSIRHDYSDLQDYIPETQAHPVINYRDRLLAWATRYHMLENWVLDSATFRLGLAALDEPLRLAVGVFAYSPPAPETILGFEYPAYTGGDSGEGGPLDYRQAQIDAFTSHLDATLSERLSMLEADPAVTRLPSRQAPRKTKKGVQYVEPLRLAARWQATGVQAAEAKTIRTALERVGLKPRPGLDGNTRTV